MENEIPREPEVPDLSRQEIEYITKIVFVEPNPQKADLIFIFGYGPGHTEQNWREVAELYKNHLSDLILVNGLFDIHAQPTHKVISHIIRDYLVKFGVPKDNILIQDSSKNTLEDVVLGKKFLESNKTFPKRILYVCKSHHSGRCYLTLKKYFPDAELFAYTFNAVYNDITEVSKKDWWKDPVARARVYGEYLRINNYSERGDICKP